MISNHPAGGHWYDGTFYISTSGQGILAKVSKDRTLPLPFTLTLSLTLTITLTLTLPLTLHLHLHLHLHLSLSKIFEEEPVDTSVIPSIEQRTTIFRMGSR